MAAPIECAIMREAFSQAPAGEREGAYALGATRWGMIRSVVLPFGRGGIVGGMMLGLGRALGETIAVYLIISPDLQGQLAHPPGGRQLGGRPHHPALLGRSSGFGLSALLAAGFALFVLTMIVNFTASMIMARSRSGAQTEG